MFTGFNYKYIFSLTAALLLNIFAFSQSVKIIKDDGNFRTEYYALKNDTSKREGSYKLFYKNKIIENGNYINNQKAGNWQFFSLNGILEYEFDFDSYKVVKMSGKEKEDLENKTPCLFLGSPLIPYLYIVNNMHYPEQARKQNLGGQVVLALKISKEGELWSMYLYKKIDSLLDSEVMRVARSFPSNWKWLPATRNGTKIDGEYLITIEFEPE